MQESQLIDRDISWLSFNYRVLQEAKDPSVPLYEKIKFLAIYSSNLDEFYRVRIPAIRNYKKLRRKEKDRLQLNPKKVLNEVLGIILDQQEELGRVFREEILPELRKYHIHIISDEEYDENQVKFARTYFEDHILPLLDPKILTARGSIPFLGNQKIYLIGFFTRDELGIVEIPSGSQNRFITLPERKKEYYISYLDDVMRNNFYKIFPGKEIEEIISVKVSRDAEIYIDDEYEGDLVEKIMDSVQTREFGLPTRFLYDESIQDKHLQQLISIFHFHENDLIRGGRYHNFHDFFSLPNPTGLKTLHDPPMPSLNHFSLSLNQGLIDQILNKNYLLSFPYQSFAYIPSLINEAAKDPRVTEIKITLYRVSKDSKIAGALKQAVANGKQVTAFLEVKARFDEQSNFFWGNELRNAGARVIFSFPGIKVHSKLFLIKLNRQNKSKCIAYLGTGNFNENTAKIYGDHALLTSDDTLCKDVSQVFQILERKIIIPQTQKLLVSPFTLRNAFTEMIEEEIRNARNGRPAYIIAKMNSLEDDQMIMKLYEAGKEGVQVHLIVRGISRIISGKPNFSDSIDARSIVDRFLEHTRVYIFANGGEEKMYLASADWMTRNLDRRIEVAFPIHDVQIYKDVRILIDFQLRDNLKARSLNDGNVNVYCRNQSSEEPVRAQVESYRYLQKQLSTGEQIKKPDKSQTSLYRTD